MPLSRWLLTIVLACAPVAVYAADAPDGPTFADVGLYSIRERDLLGLIDRKGRVVLAPEFEDLKIGDGLIVARKGYRVAYFDRAGTMVIRPQDKAAQPFAESLVPIPSGKGMGYADKSLNVAIEGPFAQALPFSTGLAAVAVPTNGACRNSAISTKPASSSSPRGSTRQVPSPTVLRASRRRAARGSSIALART